MTETVTDLLADIEPIVRGWIAEQIGDNANSNIPGDQFEFEFSSLADGDTLYYDGSAFEWKNTSVLSTFPATGSVIDITSTEALLVRKNSDGGDVFIVDSTNTWVGIGNANTNRDLDYTWEVSGDDAILVSGFSVFSDVASDEPLFYFRRGRGTRFSPEVLQNNDVIGSIRFAGQWSSDLGDKNSGAKIEAIATGTWERTDTPTMLKIYTVPTGLGVLVERMQISSAGHTIFNDTGIASNFTIKSDNDALLFNLNGGTDVIAIGGASDASFKLAIHGQQLIDHTSTEALLVRKNADGGDVLIVDTTNSTVTMTNTGLHLLDTNASHDLIIKPGSDLGADRILTLTTGDAARTITLSGNPTLADWFDQSVKVAASPTFADVFVPDGGTFGISGNELLTFNASGSAVFSGCNVGIGAAPGELLTVTGTGALPVIRCKTTTTGSNNQGLMIIERGDEANGFAQHAYATGAITSWSIGLRSGDTDLHFYDNNNSVDRLLLLDTGNVLVGTAVDNGQKFQVGGNFQSVMAGANTSEFESTGNSVSLYITRGAIGNYATIQYRIGNVVDWSMQVRADIDDGKAWVLRSGAGANKAILLQSGYFGLNVTPTAQLHVDQSSASAAVPVLLLDQGDVSEQLIKGSYSGADVDMTIIELDVTGAPKFGWLDTPDVFTLNKGLAVGDGGTTNYANFAGDGELTLFGTARVTSQIPIDNANLGKGNTAPTQIIIGDYNSWEYDINDDTVFTFHIPHDWAAGTAITISIDWFIDQAYVTNSGEVKWQIVWAATPHDASEPLDGPTHTGTADTGDINIPAIAKAIKEDGLTIAGASLSTEDQVGVTISRIALTDGNNPSGNVDPAIVDIHIQYIADKLGENT